MTVESSKNKSGPFAVTGGSGTFPRDFLVNDADQLRVIRVRSGVEEDLVTGVSHTGIGTADGTVTVTSGIQAGDQVYLLRAVPMLQRTDYSSQGKVRTDQVEADFDAQEMQIQDLAEKVARALMLPLSSNATGETLLAAILNAQQYAEDVEQAAAEALGVPTYPTLAAAQAAEVSAFVNVIAIPGAQFERSATDVALTTADGATWRPVGTLKPYHFGAIPWDMTVNYETQFNAMSAWLRARYDATAGAFKTQIDLCGQTWRCDSWNLTNIRQPAFAFGNGTIVSFGTGRTVIDCAGTNHGRIIGELSIEAPVRTSAPAVGMCIGRAEFGGSTAPIAPDWAGRIRVDGYFAKASFVNIASEVSRLDLHLTNRSRGFAAYCLVHVGHMGTIDQYLTGGLTSEYCTLPTAAYGGMSNILHDYGMLICKHAADVALPILGITRASPAVVSVDPTALAGASLAVGDYLWFHDHGGMDELKRRRVRVRALNLGAGTISLNEEDGSTPVNSSAYAAWTSGGRVWNAAGPAALFGGGIASVNIHNGYFLAYGNNAIVWDCSRGSTRSLNLTFQAEAHCISAILFHTGTENCLMQDVTINVLSSSQYLTTGAVQVSTNGTLRIDGLNFEVGAYPGAPGNAVWVGSGVTSIRNGKIRYPYAAHAQWSGWDAFSGRIEAMDTNIARDLEYNGATDVSYAYPSATSAQIQSAAHAINTTGKYGGLAVWDTTNSRILYAANGIAAGVWKDGAGTVVYTPT